MSEVHRLFESFSKPDIGEWTSAASSEINGANPFENLRWKTEDGLDSNPFYSQDDIADLKYLDSFQLNGEIPGAEPRQWVNMPRITVANTKAANQMALTHLQQEAEGVLFVLPPGFHDFETLMNGISWEHCSVSFVGDADQAKQLEEFIQHQKYDLIKITGGYFSTGATIPNKNSSVTAFHWNGIAINGSTPVNEIVTALIEGTKTVEALQSEATDINTIFRQIGFSIPLSTHLLVEVAKLRALRMLWFQVARAYGASGFNSNDLYLHGRSEPFVKEKFQPHGNLLKSTIAALAGISGGLNAVTIQPEDEDNAMMARIARNVSLILRLESQLGKVNDPFAGAYGIEVLEDKIAKEAWNKFQSLQ